MNSRWRCRCMQRPRTVPSSTLRARTGWWCHAGIVVGHRAGLAGLERQARLGAVEGLDLALFVDRQHDRMARRRQIEADDVRELGDELGITAALEGADAMRLQLVGRPDPLHGAQGQPGSLGHHATGPVGRLARRRAAGQRHHTLHHGVRRGRLPGFLVLSRNSPSTPASAKRCCQRQTAGRLIPARRATSATSSRSAEARMIRARATCFCGRLRSARTAAKRWRSSAETKGQTVCAIKA